MTAPRGIVVGIDGSSGADAALAWAADEAARRDTRLLITHVGDEPNSLALSAATAAAVRADLVCHAARLLTTAACVVEARQPGIEVQTADLWGNAVEGLIELSDDADLVVVGRRGVHRGIDALLGGVSHRVAAYGRCPVAVVPYPAPSAGGGRPTIAVGVGRSAAGMEALEDAFQHAERLGERLLAVRAWGELDWVHSMSTYTPQSAERWRLASQHLLDHCVRTVASRYPSVPVDARLVRGRTVAALLDAAREAQVLCIGGRHTDRRMSRLGWTASVLLAQAPCVVEVVAGPSAALEFDAESAVAGAVPPPAERTQYAGVWPTDYAYGS